MISREGVIGQTSSREWGLWRGPGCVAGGNVGSPMVERFGGFDGGGSVKVG